VLQSKAGCNRFGLGGCYTSEETLHVLDISTTVTDGNIETLSSRADIHAAYAASADGTLTNDGHGKQFGLSSGSGCSIIRLTGEDAESVQGLMNFADTFFKGVDDDTCNQGINEVGVFRVDNNVHSGFDRNVNEEGKMQVLYGLLMPDADDCIDPMMFPMEIGDLVGQKSISDGHRGMRTLFNVSKQITSAVLDMDKTSTKKIVDDCTTSPVLSSGDSAINAANVDNLTDKMSNSYQRLIRYLQPKQNDESVEEDGNAPAFWPHVDSTLLTLIPLPEVPGLEVWAPSLHNAKSHDLSERGEWVQPIRPEKNGKEEVYVVALAGEFLQLLSNGRVPACIHRVMPTSACTAGSTGGNHNKYNKPRISAPLFVRPRRTEEAILDTEDDFYQGKSGLYFQEGLSEECDQMHIWEYMNTMSPGN